MCLSENANRDGTEEDSQQYYKHGRFRQFGKQIHTTDSESSEKSATKNVPCIPLTEKQHRALGEAAIIRRLVRRQNFAFAAQVSVNKQLKYCI